jgi:hypothetical protein
VTDLEDELMKSMADEIQKEIDGGIMMELLGANNWHKVKLYPMTMETSEEVDAWVASNTKGRHWTQGIVWMFEQEQDAMWFNLRWANKQ